MVREQSPEKRDLFLHTALRLFASNGFKNTSTADITREAGTAAGTLFLYFPTKQDLVNELALWISRQEAIEVNSRLTAGMGAREMLAVVWHASIHWLLDNKDAYKFSRQIREPGVLSLEIIEQTALNFSFYYEAIRKGLADGILKDYPADLIGGFLYQGIVAVMEYIPMQPDSTRHEEIIRQGFEIFWNGIRSTTS